MASSGNIINTFDNESIKRIGDAVLKVDQSGKKSLPDPTRDNRKEIYARFKLIDYLDERNIAMGRRMTRLDDETPGEYQWILTGDQEKLRCDNFPGRLAIGTEVMAVLGPDGWSVIYDGIPCNLSAGTPVVSHGAYRVSSGTTDGVVLLSGATKYHWHEEAITFVGNIRSDANESIRNPDGEKPAENESRNLRNVITGSRNLPRWVAFDKESEDLPEQVLKALGWDKDGNPAGGEYWGVGTKGKLVRTGIIMPLYWYRWKPDLESLVCSQDSVGVYRWMIQQEGSDILINTGYPCTPAGEDPETDPASEPPEVLTRGAYWIAPKSWTNWGYGGWGWGNWGWNYGYGWNYPSWAYGQWGNPIAGSGTPYYWGAWGYRWWVNRWNGNPPPMGDQVLNEDDTEEANYGNINGLISRLCLYGYIVWTGGYKILNVDSNEGLAFVDGPIKWNIQEVVVNQSWQECEESTGS